MRARDEFLDGRRVASTLVTVPALARPEWRVELVTTDGAREPLDASSLRAAPEGALRWLSVAVPLFAAGLLVARI